MDVARKTLIVWPLLLGVALAFGATTVSYGQGDAPTKQIVVTPTGDESPADKPGVLRLRADPEDTEAGSGNEDAGPVTPVAEDEPEDEPEDTPAPRVADDEDEDDEPAPRVADEEEEDEPAPRVADEPKDEEEDSDPIEVASTGKMSPPDDPVAAAAFGVLQKHCARCHQEGELVKKLKPAKDFGNVLELDELSKDPKFIVPGNPDGSSIIKEIVSGEMPYDVMYGETFDYPEPTSDEIEILKAWINKLGEDASAGCKDRAFITEVDAVRWMVDDLNDTARSDQRGTRYITLTHLWNACASEEAMKVYQQGVVKLLNSLSTESDVLKLETIDEYGTIIKFNLDDINWPEEYWDTVLSIYPYNAVLEDSEKYLKSLADYTYTPLPYIRGDWFAFNASRPPLYHVLLDLAPDFHGLQEDLNLDVLANIRNYDIMRAGFQDSGVSENNRMIERHTISTGYFWTSYDFAGNADRQSLYEFPLGPGDSEWDFHHDGGESIFSLPNGFQAYYLNTADGARLNVGPINIVHDLTQKDKSVTNGLSCMGCHDQGIRKAQDFIRAHVLESDTFPREVERIVEEIYPEVAEMDEILEADTRKFRNAMIAAGLDPALKLNGVEMINALSKRYEQDVDIALAAAEFGLTTEEFAEPGTGAGDREAYRLANRLNYELVPRDTIEKLYLKVAEEYNDYYIVDLSGLNPKSLAEPVKVAEKEEKYEEKKAEVYSEPDKPYEPVKTAEDYVEPPKEYKEGDYKEQYEKPVEVKEVAVYAPSTKKEGAAKRTFELSLFADKKEYYVGEPITFFVKSEVFCYLTLVNVDSHGVTTQLFPNEFDKDNALHAGVELAFPGEKAGFEFTLSDPGKEKVIATCSTKVEDADYEAPEYKDGEVFATIDNYDEKVKDKRTRKIEIKKRERAETTAKPEQTYAEDDLVARAAIVVPVLEY